MSTRIVLAALALLASLLSGCMQTYQFAGTPSGKPEAIIMAEVASIKSAIIGEMVNHRYQIDQDTEYMLRLSRPLEGGENFGAALAVGNSYSTNKRVTTYTFVKQPDGAVRVIVSSVWAAQMPGGQENSSDVTNVPANFELFKTQLAEIKNRLEKK